MAEESRRNALKTGAGVVGVSAGITTGLAGIISTVLGAKTVSNPTYWNNEPVSTAYEPAIEHAAETGELDIKTVHLDYESHSESERLDSQTYQEELQELMMELPGIENVETSYEFLQPEEVELVPDTVEDMAEFKAEGLNSGLQSLMAETGEEVREEDYQLVNLMTISGKIYEKGLTSPEIEGVAYIQESGTLDQRTKTTAHEDAHLLGIGHTLADGMTNVPFGEIYADHTQNYFGSKSREWWKGIMEKHS